jgi:transcription factor TFIIIB component B''
MDTLSRLTGKDFSGPTPVIRAPTPLMLVDDPATKENDPSGAVKSSTPAPSKSKRKKGKTAALAPDEEIVGSADTFVDMDDDA